MYTSKRLFDVTNTTVFDRLGLCWFYASFTMILITVRDDHNQRVFVVVVDGGSASHTV
jgi:hypothetical protein